MRLFFLLLLLPGPVAVALAADWVVLNDAALSTHGKMDGDSIPVTVQGTNFIYNLYFIDAPETWTGSKKAKEQADHWGKDPEAISALAKKIGPGLGELLQGGFEIHTLGHAISKAENRYYGMVKVGDRWLSEILVEAGLARPKGKTAPLADGTTGLDFMNRLRALEEAAKLAGKGLWSMNPAGEEVAFSAPAPAVVPNPAKEAPAGEFEAGQVITLDEALPVYRMDKKFRPAGSLPAGRRIRVMDPKPLLRVLVEIPGKAAVEVLIRPEDLSGPPAPPPAGQPDIP